MVHPHPAPALIKYCSLCWLWFGVLRASPVCCRQGFVESKIRQLLMRVEMVDGIVLAHPFNTSFDKVHYCSTDDEAAQVATGETIRQVRAESTNLQKTALSDKSDAPSAAESKITVYTSTFYIGLVISLKDGKNLLSERCLTCT